MTVKEVAERLGLTVFSGAAGLEREVTGGYTSDLLSDVMGFAREGQLWVTLQTHRNAMGVASLKELAAIVLVKGFRPDDDTISSSEDEGIPILGSDLPAFELSGRLYELLR
ncbi:MAG: serine kinase [Rikenellaceae bacterium]|nr:serine kinase [Rikenellaceae bacterium]MCL2692818.1 serine kinase [Rikenellaceae bacterium]